MNILSLLYFGTIICLKTSAFVISSNIERARSPLYAIQTVSLDSLQNHEEEGTHMAESIVKWLDDEWMVRHFTKVILFFETIFLIAVVI